MFGAVLLQLSKMPPPYIHQSPQRNKVRRSGKLLASTETATGPLVTASIKASASFFWTFTCPVMLAWGGQ